MTHRIDRVFNHARINEPSLGGEGFLAQFQQARLALPMPPKAKYDWLTLVAVILAMCCVYKFTSVGFWIEAIAYQNTFLSIALMAGVGVCVSLCAVLFSFERDDWVRA